MSAAKQASMDSARTIWRTRSGSAPAWACAYGAAPDLGLNYERVVTKPAGEPNSQNRALHLQAIVVKHADRRHATIQLQGGVGGGPLGVERTRSRLFLGRRLPAQMTPSAEDRFVRLPVRSQGDFERQQRVDFTSSPRRLRTAGICAKRTTDSPFRRTRNAETEERKQPLCGSIDG